MSSAFIINPGAGNVRDTLVPVRRSYAERNARVFAKECGASAMVPVCALDDEGRWDFRMKMRRRTVLVSMPGCSLARVRYVDPATQNIWLFPRLYLDGSSYCWLYAKELVLELDAP